MTLIKYTFRVLILASIFNITDLVAQVPELGYAISFGSELNDAGTSIAVDDSGNSYTVGSFKNTVNFGSVSITASGTNSNQDVFVVKHNIEGEVIWARPFGWVVNDIALGIKVDGSGNSYVTGRISYQITVDGIIYDTNNESQDVFVLKLDTEGNVVWFTTFGGTASDVANSLAIDGFGNVYITGSFVSNFTVGTETLTGGLNEEVFVVKLNNDGTPAWVHGFGGIYSDIGRGIGVDDGGNCYVTGSARGNINVGAYTIGTYGLYDVFLVKYNSEGIPQWAKNFGSSDGDYSYGLAVNEEGDCFIVGSFMGNMNFGNMTIIADGVLYNDAFVAKFDNTGTAQWAQRIGDSTNEVGIAVDIDNEGNSYVTGLFSSTVITIGPTTFINQGNSDAFISKLNNVGAIDWSIQIGGSGYESGNGIAVHPNGNVYATGQFSDSMNIDGNTLTSNGDYDPYLVKFGTAVITDVPFLTNQLNRIEVGRYNLLGQRINPETQGIQIVRYSDGSSKKVYTSRTFR